MKIEPKDPYYTVDMMKFKVKYGDSYEQKWEQVFEKIDKQQFQQFLNSFEKYALKQFGEEKLKTIYNNIEGYSKHHPEMIKEINAIHKVFPGCQVHQLYLINFTYEIFAHQDACLSIVVQNDQGELFMGRNLDFFFQKYYSQFSIKFDHYDENDKLIYSTSQFVGYVITVQGVKYGKFAISLNERDSQNFQANLEGFLKGYYSNEYLMQVVFQKAENYEQALEMLQNENVIAGCYYILTGNEQNQGAGIEREQNKPYATYYLDKDNWYLVFTNYDQDKQDKDGRRTSATQLLNQIGKENITFDKLHKDVITQFPQLHQLTISSSMMWPKQSEFQQYVYMNKEKSEIVQ